jgi:hypothetical protein
MWNILVIFSRNILPARRSAELAGDLHENILSINSLQIQSMNAKNISN